MTGYSTLRFSELLVDINALKQCKNNKVPGSGSTTKELIKRAESYQHWKFGHVSNECNMGNSAYINERKENK
jgi:hypothetical protein